MRLRPALPALLTLAAALTTPLPGQDSAPPLVVGLEVEYIGIKTVSPEAVLARVQTREGTPLDQGRIDRSVRALIDTGLFETVDVRPRAAAGGVVLTYIVEPRYRVGSVEFVGNKEKTRRYLLGKIETRQNEVLDELTVTRDQATLLETYEKLGYSQAVVHYDITRDPATGYGTVVFNITEGQRLKISSVRFVGNDAIPTKKLLKQMETKEYGFFSWLSGSGRFNEATFRDDLGALRDYYKNEGYLDVELGETGVDLEYPRKGKIAITITIGEGRQYRVGQVTVEGNTLFPSADLLAPLKLKTGEVFSPATLEEDRVRLEDHYGRDGYLDTAVRVDRPSPNLQTGDIDLRYRITEGEKNFVETVEVVGNTTTKSTVILRELALEAGDVFDTVKMKNSEARLKNMGFFEEVDLRPEEVNIPNRKALKVAVREGRTGSLTFGAGFSSLDNGVIFVELTQKNFDLFNRRSFFQGDGQKFRLRLSLGGRSNEVILSFEEPWFRERRLAVGFELFRTETDYRSTDYNELRTGFEIYARKQLANLWRGRLSYRLEVVDIFEVDDDAALKIRRSEGNTSVSKVGLSLSRDTRDKFIFTSKGNRVSLRTELAGLGGDAEYLKVEARGSHHRTLFDSDGTHVLSFKGRIGTIFDLGETPFFDLYYLGGPGSLRGFDYEDVGPKDEVGDPTTVPATPPSFDPIGGHSLGYGSVEYGYKVAEPLQLAIFYDWGFVNPDETDWSFSDYNDNWGVGVRLLVLGAPLHLDYGIPITTDDHNDDGNQFNFSFGTRF